MRGQEPPATGLKGHTYRRFKAFYARYWHVSPSTLFRVYNWSLTGSTAWLEMNDELKPVPRGCLVDSAEWDWQRARCRVVTEARYTLNEALLSLGRAGVER